MKVPTPQRMRALPHHKGLPVPAMVQFDAKGVPDFKVIDMEKWMRLARLRRCGLCGVKMPAEVWFIGVPQTIETRTFPDLPKHEDCAKYALRVCPYLALPRYRYAMANVQIDGQTINANEHALTQRPNRFGLACATRYQGGIIEGTRTCVVIAAPFLTVEWWQQGRRITQ